MNRIDILIFNALARCRSVALPGFGTLASERRSAVLIDRKKMLPPSYRLFWAEALPADMEAVQLVETGLAIDRKRAEQEYERWAKELTAEEVMQRFEAELNLGTKGVVRLRPKKRAGLWLFPLFALLLLSSALCYMRRDTLGRRQGRAEIVLEAPVLQQEADAQPVNESMEERGSVASDVYHIVIGVFSTEENADKFIASKPQLTLAKLDSGSGRVLVCIYSAATREDAAMLRDKVQGETEPAAWIWNSETKSAVNNR